MDQSTKKKREVLDVFCTIALIGILIWIFWFKIDWSKKETLLRPTNEARVYLVTLIDGDVAATLGPITDYETCLFIKEEDNKHVTELQEQAQTDENLALLKDIKVENFCVITKYRPQVK